MSVISRGIKNIYFSTVKRKTVHLVFSLLLITPFTSAYRDAFLKLWPNVPDPTLISLSVLLFLAATLNSIQIRSPSLRERFLKVSADLRKRLMESLELISKGGPHIEVFESILKSLAKYEERFTDFVSSIERDYELRYGYISITFALLSVTMSYVLFGYTAIYGILALAIVDTVSSITTLHTISRRGRLKHSDISIATTFAIFALSVYIISKSLYTSIIVSAIAIATELLSPEDNLTLPIVTSFTAYLLAMPTPFI